MTRADIVVRETPAHVVRERWAAIQVRVHQLRLRQHLDAQTRQEQADYATQTSVEPVKKSAFKQWYGDWKERIGVMICCHFHYHPAYQRGDEFTTCVCGRRYAVPWAKQSSLPYDVYVQAPVAMPTERTYQVECRGAHARIVEHA